MEDFAEIQEAAMQDVAASQVKNAVLQPETKTSTETTNSIVNESIAGNVTGTTVAPVESISVPDIDSYFEETRFEARPTLWQRIKKSKFVRTIRYIMQIRVVLDYPALPEGRGENY